MGYGVSKSFFEKADLDDLRANLFAASGGVLERQKAPLILSKNAISQSPQIAACPAYQKLLAFCQSIMGGGAKCCYDQGVIKRPYNGAPVPVHQDRAHQRFAWARPKTISAFVPLCDTHSANGGIYYFPRSHTRGLLKHTGSDSDHFRALCEVEESEKDVLDLVYGDVAFHSDLTLHGSSQNLSPQPRPAWVFQFSGFSLNRLKQQFFTREPLRTR